MNVIVASTATIIQHLVTKRNPFTFCNENIAITCVGLTP